VRFEVQDDLLAANRSYVTCQVDEDLPYILRFTAPDTLLVGSDYGHSDPSQEHQFARLLERRGQAGDVPRDLVHKLTYQNAKTLYGL
jgi:hypothetical protein